MTVRQRQPRVEDPAFLAFLRKLPCCACGAHPPVQAAHLRMGSPERGKPSAGLGTKPSDCWATPLCQDCHLDGPQAQHRTGERRFWARLGLDPFAIAERLYEAFRAIAGPSVEEPRPPKLRLGMKVTGPGFPPGGSRIVAIASGGKIRVSKRKLIKRPKRNETPKRKWASRPFPAGQKLRSHR